MKPTWPGRAQELSRLTPQIQVEGSLDRASLWSSQKVTSLTPLPRLLLHLLCGQVVFPKGWQITTEL